MRLAAAYTVCRTTAAVVDSGDAVPDSAAHASIDIADLDAGVRFYRVLFGEPVVVRADCVRFETSEPPFVLVLLSAPAERTSGRVNHLGFRLPDAAALERHARRLAKGGLAFERETGDGPPKLWLVDPDGTIWELYVGTDADAVPDPRRWIHRPADGVLTAIPADDASLDDVLLDGTLNGRHSPAELHALLRDARRALRPGGTVRLHGLVASGPIPAGATLPGAASGAERVPVEAEPFTVIARAGFSAIRATTLPDRPSLRVGPVELREIRVTAERPSEPESGRFLPVTYKGPFARVEDDAGQIYERGQRVWIAEARRDALASGPLADAFAIFDVPVSTPGEGSR